MDLRGPRSLPPDLQGIHRLGSSVSSSTGTALRGEISITELGVPTYSPRCCLIRNQIAIARSSDVTFATQFFVRFSFIGRFSREEDFSNLLAELFFG